MQIGVAPRINLQTKRTVMLPSARSTCLWLSWYLFKSFSDGASVIRESRVFLFFRHVPLIHGIFILSCCCERTLLFSKANREAVMAKSEEVTQPSFLFFFRTGRSGCFVCNHTIDHFIGFWFYNGIYLINEK